jgi:hypothetical protein
LWPSEFAIPEGPVRRRRQPHGCRDADQRGATHPKGLNRLDHLLNGIDLQEDRFAGQERLVEEADRSLVGPVNRFGVHGLKNYRRFQRTVSLRPWTINFCSVKFANAWLS